MRNSIKTIIQLKLSLLNHLNSKQCCQHFCIGPQSKPSSRTKRCVQRSHPATFTDAVRVIVPFPSGIHENRIRQIDPIQNCVQFIDLQPRSTPHTLEQQKHHTQTQHDFFAGTPPIILDVWHKHRMRHVHFTTGPPRTSGKASEHSTLHLSSTVPPAAPSTKEERVRSAF